MPVSREQERLAFLRRPPIMLVNQLTFGSMAKVSNKRERLVAAAKQLIHRQGVHKTTLAEIARESGVALGNVYYYFKTKDEICEAVLEDRKQEISTTLEVCRQCTCPGESLKKLCQVLTREADRLAENGCPNAGLCQDLEKVGSELAASADECMLALVSWCTDQFEALGVKDARDKGFEFMARIQGTMLLGHTLHDARLIRHQLKRLRTWVDELVAGLEAKRERNAA